MEKEHDVFICFHDINLDVCLPKEQVFDFMEKFGVVFSRKFEGSTKQVKTINYSSNFIDSKSWHLKITIWENDENKFYDFLKSFCEEKNLSFRDPRIHKD